MIRVRHLPLVVLLFASPAAAQPSDPAAGAWMSSWADGAPTTGMTPALWLGSRGFGYSVGGTVAVGIGGGSGMATISGLGDAAAIEFGANAAGGSISTPGRHRSILSARVHPPGMLGNTWLGAALLEVDRRETGVLPLIGAGTWGNRGRFTYGMRTVQILSQIQTSRLVTITESLPFDTAGVPVGTARTGSVRENDYRLMTGAEASAGWSANRLEFQSRLGVIVALHQDPGTWSEMRVAYWPMQGWALFARARSASGVPEALESVRGTHAALGVQLTPGRGFVPVRSHRALAEGLVVRALGDGRYSLRIRAQARRVEVRSDATDWTPVPAGRIEPGLWEVVLSLTPGVHRVAVRVDSGRWRAPAGLPAAADDFGGAVGLIVAE